MWICLSVYTSFSLSFYIFPSMCESVFPFMYLSVCLSTSFCLCVYTVIYLSVCISTSFCLSVNLSVRLYTCICQSVCLHLPIYLWICLSVYTYIFLSISNSVFPGWEVQNRTDIVVHRKVTLPKNKTFSLNGWKKREGVFPTIEPLFCEISLFSVCWKY